MGVYGLNLLTWDGHDIQSDEYVSQFVEGGETRNTLRGQAVEVVIPGATPKHLRVQPDGMDFDVEIEINDTYSQERLDTLKQWFSPLLEGERQLVATDGNNVQRRANCVCVHFEVKTLGGDEAVQIFVAHMRNASGLWEAVDGSSDEAMIVVSGQTAALTNAGSTDAPLQLVISAAAAKASSASYNKLRWLPVANRSERALTDFVGDGYPVLLCNLVALGIAQIDDTWDHVRLFRNGQELYRWITSAGDLWANLNFRPRKVATLGSNIDANVESLTVSNPDGFRQGRWPANGFFIIDGECVQYSGRGDFSSGTLTRGARGTNAAAHLAGATLYWQEHAYLWLAYGYEAAEDPAPPDNLKPGLDLEASTNALCVLPEGGPFFNNGDRRSRMFRREKSGQDAASQHIREYDSAGQLFEDLLPSAGKPNFNDAVMDFPVPVKARVDAIVIDLEVNPSMLLECFVEDLDGNESRLFSQFYTALLSGEAFSPGDALQRVRLHGQVAAILGDLSLAGLASWPASATSVTTFVLNPGVDLQANRAAGGIGLPGTTVFTNLYTAIHFRLDQETSIDGFLLYCSAHTPYGIYTDGGGGPAEPVAFGTFNAGSTGLNISLFDRVGTATPLALPSGDYWMVFIAEGTIGVHTLRTEPNVYLGQHTIPGQHPATIHFPAFGGSVLGSEAADVPWPDTPDMHQNNFTVSPIFAVLSRTTEPQADAPLQTGNIARADNHRFVLDETRAPLIVPGQELDLYLLDGTLGEDDTLQLFFPLVVGNTLTVDAANHRVTDGETGLRVPWAVAAASKPPRWLALKPGANTLTWTESGVSLLDIVFNWRSKWL